MLIRSRAFLIAVVTTVSVGALIGVPPSGAQDAEFDPARAGVAPIAAPTSPAGTGAGSAKAAACSDVLVVGLRGSGQKASQRMGEQVNSFVSSLIPRLVRRSHSTRELTNNEYKAAPIEELYNVFDLVQGKNKFFKSIDEGVDSTVGILANKARSCPKQRLVLAGYSQGAMVLHRAVNRLHDHDRSDVLRRIDGLVLIADGDRVSGAKGHLIGVNEARRSARGIYDWLPTGNRDVRGVSPEQIWSICSDFDVVCDFRHLFRSPLLPGPFLPYVNPVTAAQIKHGADIHIGNKYIGSEPIRRAAAQVAREVRFTPKIAASTLVEGAPGVAINRRLTADTSAGASSLRWRTTSPLTLPNGVTITSAGVIQGIPSAAYSGITALQVRAVSAGRSSSWVDAHIVWNIEQGAGCTPAGTAPMRPQINDALVADTSSAPSGHERGLNNMPHRAAAVVELHSTLGNGVDDDESAPIHITVKDANGQPVPGAPLDVTFRAVSSQGTHVLHPQATTDGQGQAVVSVRGVDDIRSVLTVTVTAGTASAAVTIESDNSRVRWDGGPSSQHLFGTSASATGVLELPSGLPLPGRTLRLNLQRSQDANSDGVPDATANALFAQQNEQPPGLVRNSDTDAQAVTSAAGTFGVLVVDPALPSADEANDELQASSDALQLFPDQIPGLTQILNFCGAPPGPCHPGTYNNAQFPPGGVYTVTFSSGGVSMYDGTISWGDGAITTTSAAGSWSHVYSTPGSYTIHIEGSGSFGDPPTLCSDNFSASVGVTTPPPPPPPPPPTPAISLTRGGSAPAGYWYSTSLSGFTPGSQVALTCHDSVDPGGFYTQTFTIAGDGTAADGTLCYSADGPDHWVTGGGVESNHVGW